ncbi:MAG: uroporphyrinogen decarboxylase [Thaumarchaeota archaeon]|nr:uroporphyrinogen decarboxylase [Nitrososphaerota archaeon]
MNERILKACRLERTDYAPIWLMRQAGRYLPEYREIRRKHDLLTICKTPELAAKVAAIPVEKFQMDAAIVFADIILPLEAIGVSVRVDDNMGPVIESPVKTNEQIESFSEFDPQTVSFVYEAIRHTRRALNESVPVIGFSGAPFTLASYMIEGGSSKNFARTKTTMYGDGGFWKALMLKLVHVVSEYLALQVKAGAKILQLFDSWAGCLSPTDYERYVMPYSRAVIRQVNRLGIPLIHFGTDTASLLTLMKEAGGDIMGVDWRIDIDNAWKILGPNHGIQGNLDPAVMLTKDKIVVKYAKQILDKANGQPGHIFNLGHGVLPQTPPENVKILVDFVHSYRVN